MSEMMTHNLFKKTLTKFSGSRLDNNQASTLIDKEVQMHGEVTFGDILKKNNITSRRGIASVFYSLLTKAKAEQVVPTQVFYRKL